jgi:putative hydrolase of the HAD superfamily
MAASPFLALFSDVGGVLGTNGWDGNLRTKITSHFQCDPDEIEARHHLMFDSFERGFMTFEDYLRRVFFAQRRDFTMEEVRNFAFAESVPWPDNISLLRNIKQANQVTVGLISNEGEGLTQYRVRKFGLRTATNFSVFSCFVHMRKPDFEIWRLALNLAQVDASQTIYIDDRELFVGIAAEIGFTAFQHISLEVTRAKLQELGLLVM